MQRFRRASRAAAASGLYAAPATDPSYASVALLLHCNGSNGSTTFTDNGPLGLSVTAVGNAQVSTTNPKFGTGCLLGDGTDDLLQAGASTDWKFLHDGLTAWTIELWHLPANFSAERALLDTTAGTTSKAGLFISIDASRNIKVQITRAVAASHVLNASFTAAYPNDTSTYRHLAVTYDPALGSANCKCYIDGSLVGSENKLGNAPSNTNPTHALQIGRFALASGASLNGRIDDLRITKLVRTITVPTAEYPNS
jgi:hypothetical protein